MIKQIDTDSLNLAAYFLSKGGQLISMHWEGSTAVFTVEGEETFPGEYYGSEVPNFVLAREFVLESMRRNRSIPR